MITPQRLNLAKKAVTFGSAGLGIVGALTFFFGLLVWDFDEVLPPGHHLAGVADVISTLSNWSIVLILVGLVMMIMSLLFFALLVLFRPVAVTIDHDWMTWAILEEFEHILRSFTVPIRADMHRMIGMSEETATLLAHAPRLLSVVKTIQGKMAESTVRELAPLVEEWEVASNAARNLHHEVSDYQANLAKIKQMVDELSTQAAKIRLMERSANDDFDILQADVRRILQQLEEAGIEIDSDTTVVKLRRVVE